MTVINILHLADIHIGMENYGRLEARSGLNSRVLDFLRRMAEAVDYSLDNEADVCIFAGDAYKNQRPNPTLQREFARRIKRLVDAGIPTILLVGNRLESIHNLADIREVNRRIQWRNVFSEHGTDLGRGAILRRARIERNPLEFIHDLADVGEVHIPERRPDIAPQPSLNGQRWCRERSLACRQRAANVPDLNVVHRAG